MIQTSQTPTTTGLTEVKFSSHLTPQAFVKSAFAQCGVTLSDADLREVRANDGVVTFAHPAKLVVPTTQIPCLLDQHIKMKLCTDLTDFDCAVNQFARQFARFKLPSPKTRTPWKGKNIALIQWMDDVRLITSPDKTAFITADPILSAAVKQLHTREHRDVEFGVRGTLPPAILTPAFRQFITTHPEDSIFISFGKEQAYPSTNFVQFAQAFCDTDAKTEQCKQVKVWLPEEGVEFPIILEHPARFFVGFTPVANPEDRDQVIPVTELEPRFAPPL